MTDKSSLKSNIQESFDSTLEDSNLQNIISNVADFAIDNILTNETLKNLPIVGTLVSLGNLGANIHDKLFSKKIIAFLSGVKDVSPKDRNKMIRYIDESKKYRVKVGEKLLYIIDKCNDYETAELVSRVFKYFIEGNISYDEFLKTANVLNDIAIDEFMWFVKDGKRYYDLGNTGGMINTGLFELYFEEIGVHVYGEEDINRRVSAGGLSEYKTDVDGGMNVSLSRAGEIFLEIFCSNYEKPKKAKI